MSDDLGHVPFILLAWLRAGQPGADDHLLFAPYAGYMHDLWSSYTEPYCDTVQALPVADPT